MAGKEVNRQKRFDLIGVSKEKQEEIKTSLSKRYEKFEKALRYDIELVEMDSLFKAFMKMKNEKSVGALLRLK